MAFVNEHYGSLKDSYLFADIAHRVADFSAVHPEVKVIRMGIGDVTLPLAPCVVEAMGKAVQEMGIKESFRGYGPEQGYDFLREAIARYYRSFAVDIAKDEIFVSDGAKSDCGNITDIFSDSNTILIPDPVYPVYLDTNLMRGRKIIYMNGTPENSFLPMPDDKVKTDIIYLCSPNNPTGAVYTREQLGVWVDYALKNDAVILYDAAYESFVADAKIPRSIFAIPGAKKCAIEFCSFSKTAGFTGTRCGYTVVPKDLIRKSKDGKEFSLNWMWLRRQTTKFNGVPYVVQRGAEKVFSAEGIAQCRANLSYYQENARVIMKALDICGVRYFGGVHSPYVWMECPNQLNSWDFFDYLLTKVGVVGTPGSGFGKMGEKYFRLTAFGSRENTQEAMERFVKEFK